MLSASQARKSRKSKLGLPKKKNEVPAAASVPPPLPPKKKASAAASTPPPLPELPDIHAPLMTSTQRTTVPEREPSPDAVATKQVRNVTDNGVNAGAGTGEALIQAMADAAQMSMANASPLTGMRDEEEVIVGLRQAMTEYEEPEEAQETPAESEKGTLSNNMFHAYLILYTLLLVITLLY